MALCDQPEAFASDLADNQSCYLLTLPLIATRWNSTGCCRRLWRRMLWPWSLIFWPQNVVSTSMNQNMPVTKIGWNSVCSVLRCDVRKVFGSSPAVTLTLTLTLVGSMDSQSQMDTPEDRIPLTRKVLCGGHIKMETQALANFSCPE